MNIKNLIKDSALNIISAALPIIILQLVIFPYIGNTTSAENYGFFIILVSVFTLVSFPMGNVLNNVRLLTEGEYKKTHVVGDFNLILIGMSILGLIMIVVASFWIDSNMNIVDIVLLCLITIFSLWKEYYIVSFRLVLNYKKILINNLLTGLGFLLGLCIFLKLDYWQLIYLTGLSLSLLYIFKFSNLHKEPFKFTSLFKSTILKSYNLYLASLLKNALNYADKLILLPLIGPIGVSVYYTSTIIGKIIIMVINPINSVILSYLVKMEKVSLWKFLKAFIILIVIACISYTLTVLLSPYFLYFFYNEWAEESINLIYITTATVCIDMLASIIHPFNLRFNKSSWQVYMNLSHVVIYILSVSYFYLDSGLIGFCYGVLLASIYKLVIQLSVFIYSSLKLSRKS